VATVRYFLHAPAELPPAELKLPAPAGAQLPDFELVFDAPSTKWEGRVASLHRKRGASVYGLMYALTPAQLSAVERWRGGDKKLEVAVKTDGTAKTVKAVAFQPPAAARSVSGPVSETFLAALVRGAEQARLPADYVQRLKAEAEIVGRVQRFGRLHRLG
jgi:hypothetical protein